jgi:hypothetical protein
MRDRFGRPVDDGGIQEMMQDRFSRDEAINNSQILKKQAAGNSMETPKGCRPISSQRLKARLPNLASRMSTATRNLRSKARLPRMI